jgi:hypothetical protein
MGKLTGRRFMESHWERPSTCEEGFETWNMRLTAGNNQKLLDSAWVHMQGYWRKRKKEGPGRMQNTSSGDGQR